MRAGHFETLPEYCDYLCSPEGAEEVQQVVDALTTNFTQFLRDREHFEVTVNQVLPQLLKSNQRQFRIWSAACATGEEPYTLAFYLEARFPSAEGWDWRILATDISTRALEKALRGVYPQERLAEVPRDWLPKYFQRGFGEWAGHFRVKNPLRQRILFEQMNLLECSYEASAFDIIFCRNVMIYFDRTTQEQVISRLSRSLRPGGYLFTGRSESLSGLALPLKCLRPSIYQKPL
jgi:chemotaxis protein methyltransferase CheR